MIPADYAIIRRKTAAIGHSPKYPILAYSIGMDGPSYMGQFKNHKSASASLEANTPAHDTKVIHDTRTDEISEA